jgi:NAD(P)-dependent dehydrogenase (short-subunit alcohol dehydrogenase family)
VVTGAGGHLGSVISLALAEMGAIVVANGRSRDPLDRLADRCTALGVPGQVLASPGDVGEPQVLEQLVTQARDAAGRVDGWVNNAYDAPGGLLPDLLPDEVRETLARGLGDAILATQAAYVAMRESGAGSIVNVSSMYGMVSPQPAAYERFPEFHNPPAYGAAKAGVLQFTRYAACHFGPDGIRVNALSPGPFPKASVQEKAAGFVSELAARTPLGRVGEPADLAGAVVFLLSDASRFVTGHNLVVDGGWTAW